MTLAVFFTPAARAEVHARLKSTVRAGAGYSSDLFLGAQVGPSAEGQAAAGLRLDLSLSPVLKLWAGYDFALGAFEVTRSTSLDHQAQAGSRLRLAPGLLAELSGSFAAQSLSVAQAVDEETGLVASDSNGFELAPALRYQSGGLGVEALYTFGASSHRLASGELLADQQHLGAITVGSAMGPLWASISARATCEDSSSPDFSYLGASLHAALAVLLWDRLGLRLAVSGHRNRFDNHRLDLLLKAGAMPTLKLTNWLTLETAYGYAWNQSNFEDSDASRHYGYLGLRTEGELWRL